MQTIKWNLSKNSNRHYSEKGNRSKAGSFGQEERNFVTSG